MNNQVLGLVVLAVTIVAVVAVGASSQRSHAVHEAFLASDGCPQSAQRGVDGTIHVQPGNRTFQTLSDYVAYLSDLYTKGSKCIPPLVQSRSRDPVDGILGGLGTGTHSPESVRREGTTRDVLDMKGDEETSVKTPIQKLDDYELTRVFDSEESSRNTLSHDTKNALLGQRVLDWANLPFNSDARATQESEFVSGRMESGFRDPKSGVFFSNMEGATVEPPDVEAAKAREQKILSAYRPTEISKHVIDGETEAVGNMVHKVYLEDKNWEPVVTKVGEHQYEVTELRPKARKEKYEEESEVKRASLSSPDTPVIPPPTVDIDDRLRGDPYFDKSGVVDGDNNKFWKYKDFNQWTPGLERMFAPTMDNRAWF